MSYDSKIPTAHTVDAASALARWWIRWLPLSILFAGAAYVAWTVVMVAMVGRYHDGLTRLQGRVDVLEKELAKAKAGEATEYWSHQCELSWRRGDFFRLEPEVEGPPRRAP